jgi:hypothetical protein
MKVHGELFKVEDEVKKRLANKYSDFRTDVIEIRVGSNKIQIQLRIVEEFLKISKNELKEKIHELCFILLETCKKYQIRCSPSDILILTDEEVNRGLQIELKNENDGSLLGLIFIPTGDLYASYAFWNYTFLHELGHCWIGIKHMDIETDEILTDLVAISALKKIVQHAKLYQDTLIIRSYIGGKQGKEYFGSNIQKDVLKHPESYLKKLLLSTKAR